MDSCLMCLEIFSDRLNCIRADSKQWKELNILNIIEKHLWPLSTIHCNSWICPACWQMVDDFHQFYLRTEEAHMKLVIKLEKLDANEFCENADFDVNNASEETDENLSRGSGKKQVEKQTTTFYLDKVKSGTVGNSRKRRHSKRVERITILPDLDNSDSARDYDGIDTNSSMDENDSLDKDLPNYEENDKTIADHFKQINCDICKVSLQNFSAVLKHFFEAHQQKGYILCCRKHFFNRTDLADHIRSHSNPNYFECSECDKSFTDSSLCEEHKLRVHSMQESVKSHSCDVCGKFFKNSQNLNLHKRSHLSKTEKRNSCQDCGKLNMLTESPNSSKDKLECFPPQNNYNCGSYPEVFKKLNNIEKQQNSLMASMAEHKVLLSRLVAQNEVVDSTINIFPISTTEQLTELDMLLNVYPDSYKRQIKSLIDGNVERNLHHIFGQSIILGFNVEGILGKQRLRDYENVYTALIDVISVYNQFPDKTLRTAFQRQKKKFFKQNSRNKTKNTTLKEGEA